MSVILHHLTDFSTLKWYGLWGAGQLVVTVAQATNHTLPDFMHGWPDMLYVPQYIDVTSDSQHVHRWLLASASIPYGVLPSVTSGEGVFVDGGIVDNAPVLAALEAGCREIFVVHTSHDGVANGQAIATSAGISAHLSRCLDLRALALKLGTRAIAMETKSTRLAFSAKIIHIIPSKRTPSLLHSLMFSSKSSLEDLMELGYLDTIRVLESA